MSPARDRLLAALRPYLIRRRIIGAAAGALIGLAVAGVLAGLAALFFGRVILADARLQWALLATVVLPAMGWSALPLQLIDAALAIERAFPFLQDRVATAVDLISREPRRIPRSEGVTRRVTEEAAGALGELPIARAAPLGAVRTPALIAVLGLSVAALAWSAAPAHRTPEHPPPSPSITEEPEALDETPQPPRILDVSLTVQPPAYCDLPRRTITSDLDAIRAPVGSAITVHAVCSRPDASVRFVTDGGGMAEHRPSSDGRVTHSLRLTEALRWRLEAAGASGSSATPWRTIVATEDSLPTVRIVRPDSDVTLAMPEAVDVSVVAGDDFGVSAMGLRMRLADESEWRSLPLETSPGASAASSVRLNPEGVGLTPGGELIVRAWATDNDAVSGPKTALSDVLRIRLEEPGEPQRAAPETPVEQAQREEADAMEELQRTAEELQRHLSETIEGAERELRAMRGEPGEAREMPTRPGMELQEAARRLKEQAGRMEQAMRKADEQLASEEISPELVEKVRELHELMRDTLDEEMRRALEELQRAIEAQSPEEMRMSLEAAREAQERFMQRLEQTMSLLKRARMEALLGELRKEAEELAKRQAELSAQAEEMREGRSEQSREAEQDQRLLARDTRPLADRVEAATEQAREIADELAVELGAIADRLRREDPAGQMRQAASALGRGSPSDARGSQQQAGQSLHRAADDLKALEEQLASDFTAEARRKLAEMLRDTLSLSHSQEALRDSVEALGGRSQSDLMRDKRPISPLRRRQSALTEATRALADRMGELAQETPAIDPMLASAAQMIAEQMAQSAREIEGADLSSAIRRGGSVTVGLNELAKKLLETDDQLSQQSAQSTLSEYMERLKSLAERQEGLNQQTGEGQQGESGERRPGQGPGMSTSQMAYEQALIQQALREMLREGGEGEGEATGPIADQLGGVPDEMEKVEDDLRSGRIERETVERQERILEKMLEAQRSLYTKDQERSERKAERPQSFEPPPSPPAISPSLMSRPSLEIERGRGSEALPRGYEDLVREYYRRLGEEPPR
ncbi:MAG: hypothetical protein ACLFU7_02855 [Armatimonadota bacterium]